MILLNNNLAPKIKGTFKNQGQILSIADLTGAYDAVANPSGLGFPNPAVSQGLTSVLNIQVPDDQTFFCNNNPVYSINLFPTLPSINSAIPFVVLPQDCGFLQPQPFPDGIYSASVVETFGILVSWTRSSATITATQTAHGYATGQVIAVQGSNDLTAIPNGNYTITVTGANTYTFTGVATGATSGTFLLTSPNQYEVTWTGYFINTSAICQYISKQAAKSNCGCGNNDGDNSIYWKMVNIMDSIGTFACAGLMQKCACAIKELSDVCSCNNCNCN